MQLSCGLREISFAGVGFDLELPCQPGLQVSFSLGCPTYGGALVPTTIALQAEVVSIEPGHTGLRFVNLDLSSRGRSASWSRRSSGSCWSRADRAMRDPWPPVSDEYEDGYRGRDR